MNTDPQVVKFANERARTMADKLSLLHYEIEAWLANWTSQSISAQITAAGAEEVIDDGSSADGRAPITGTQLINMRAGLLQLQTALDTTAVSGVGAAPFAIVDAIQVNGTPR